MKLFNIEEVTAISKYDFIKNYKNRNCGKIRVIVQFEGVDFH